MFRFFSKRLTEYSNHYIDWSRIGELLQSGSHRYNKDELIARGGVVVCTAVFAYLGASLNDSDKTNCSNVTAAMVSGLLGFVLSHVAVIYPLYKKRIELKNDCKHLIHKIYARLDEYDGSISEACRGKIESDILEIRNLSLSTEHHGNASQTWGRRKRLLSEIYEKLSPEKFKESDWIIDSVSTALSKSIHTR